MKCHRRWLKQSSTRQSSSLHDMAFQTGCIQITAHSLTVQNIQDLPTTGILNTIRGGSSCKDRQNASEKVAAKGNQDQWMSFLDYRNTPTEGMDSSPVQRLMSKITKTTLPVAHLLEPEIQPDVQKNLTRKRRKAKKYFDRGSKELPELEIGQPIRMSSPTDAERKWRRGVCIDKMAPRSYIVEVNGSTYRRSRKFLRSIKNRGEESIQAEPVAETAEIQVDLPLTASPVPVRTNIQGTQPDDQPTNSSGDSIQPEVLPLSVPPSPLSQTPIKRTRSGRIVKPPSKLSI